MGSLPEGVNITDLPSMTALKFHGEFDCSDDVAPAPLPDIVNGLGCISLGETELGDLSMSTSTRS